VPLTEAELRVLELAPTHLTLEPIGQDRCSSRYTVKIHLKMIYGKLNVTSLGDAVARARRSGSCARPDWGHVPACRPTGLRAQLRGCLIRARPQDETQRRRSS
jgi:DNA-binding CsgD family transcriptional regulator